MYKSMASQQISVSARSTIPPEPMLVVVVDILEPKQ
jgi:hypothetical protein